MWSPLMNQLVDDVLDELFFHEDSFAHLASPPPGSPEPAHAQATTRGGGAAAQPAAIEDKAVVDTATVLQGRQSVLGAARALLAEAVSDLELEPEC